MSKNSIQTINKITALKNEVKNKIDNLKVRNKEKLVLAMNYIFSHPYFDSTDLKKIFECYETNCLKYYKYFL